MQPRDKSARIRASRRFAREILPEVSRTFALSVRLLPGALGRTVGCAYLLCRIADTIEDDGDAPPERKVALLGELLRALDEPAVADAFPRQAADIRGADAHVRLVRNTDRVCVVFRSLDPRSRECVARWVREMARGMAAFTERHPHGLRIQTIEEYREYCYYVAGTVGCMLTELWPVEPDRFRELWARCRQFGEALQTVNILKDVANDATQENAIYIPERVLVAHGSSHARLLDEAYAAHNRAAISELIALARTDLDQALEYVQLLPRRAVAIRAFCVLPVLYAYATLRELSRTDAMLRPGPPVKIARAEVRSLMVAGLAAVPSNRLLRRLVVAIAEPRLTNAS